MHGAKYITFTENSSSRNTSGFDSAKLLINSRRAQNVIVQTQSQLHVSAHIKPSRKQKNFTHIHKYIYIYIQV